MPIIQELLRDNYSFEQAESIQIKYHNLITQALKNNYINNFDLIKTIVGVDISYFKKGNYEYGIACAVIWNLNQRTKIGHYFTKDRINFPYKPGFLGFRECKMLAKVISKIPDKPDIIMCDGHGKIHPKRFGEAVHLGYALNMPSIGIAKNPFIGYSEWHKIEKIKGKKSPIWAEDPKTLTEKQLNELLGYAMCLNDGSKPVFISDGYKTNLDIALKISLDTTIGHRQPEPLYLADYLSKKEVNNHI